MVQDVIKKDVHKNCRFTIDDNGPTENPLESIYLNTVQTAKDMSENQNDAWRYGVVAGWDDYTEFKTKFGWTDEHIERNKRLHQKFIEAWIYIQDFKP